MIQIGACQAECAFVPGQGNPSPAAKVFAALVARGIPARDEYLYVCASFPHGEDSGWLPTNQQFEDLAKQQEEILAKLNSLEANQKKLLASAAPTARRQPPKEDYNKVYKIDIAGSPFLGKSDAPVVIVEWSDFQCPYCARATPPLNCSTFSPASAA